MICILHWLSSGNGLVIVKASCQENGGFEDDNGLVANEGKQSN